MPNCGAGQQTRTGPPLKNAPGPSSRKKAPLGDPFICCPGSGTTFKRVFKTSAGIARYEHGIAASIPDASKFHVEVPSNNLFRRSYWEKYAAEKGTSRKRDAEEHRYTCTPQPKTLQYLNRSWRRGVFSRSQHGLNNFHRIRKDHIMAPAATPQSNSCQTPKTSFLSEQPLSKIIHC